MFRRLALDRDRAQGGHALDTQLQKLGTQPGTEQQSHIHGPSDISDDPGPIIDRVPGNPPEKA